VIKKIKFYFLTDKLDNVAVNNILKLRKIGIIYKPINNKEVNHNNLNYISKFCKKNNIRFYISNSYKLVLKYKANGIFITYDNKKNLNYINFQKKIEVIGSAHNQIEYSVKARQGCSTIMLSPIFYNKKYTHNNILGVLKFNLISQYWRSKICALGGVNFNNFSKIKMTKATSVAFVSLIKKRIIKKPTYHF
jgi:thiamine monophosphate synthase